METWKCPPGGPFKGQGTIVRTSYPPGLNSAKSIDKKGGPRSPFAFSATFLVVLIVLDLVLVVL